MRYLAARRGSRFVSLFSLASILGIAVSVLAMVLVLSVMNGFENEMRARILRAVPHGQVSRAGGIEDWSALATTLQALPGIVAAAPQDRARVLLSASGKVRGGELFGVDPQQEMAVSDVGQMLLSGEWSDLQPGQFGVVLGRSLARGLGVGVGDGVNIMLPRVSVTPLGLFPRSRHFTVVGIFAVGAQPDATQLYVHLEDADRLLRNAGKVDALRLRLQDVMTAPEQLHALQTQPALAGFDVRSWRDEHRTLFNAMRMEKTMVSLMLAVIVLVATFNLVSLLTLSVADRRTDIAVLRTLGASRGDILGIFMVYGMAMGALGIVCGLLAGSTLALCLPQWLAGLDQWLNNHVLDTSDLLVLRLPSEWHWQQAASVALLSTVLCLLAVIYPAWRASTIHPAEALRYE